MENNVKFGNKHIRKLISQPAFTKPRVLVILFSSIPLIGLFLSLFYDANLAFQRSGAVLVSFVMILAYLNYFVVRDLDNAKIHKQHAENIKKNPAAFLQSLKKANPSANDEVLNSVIKTFGHDSHLQEISTRRKKLHKLREQIIHAEASAGVLGTLIWAFGDIPFT